MMKKIFTMFILLAFCFTPAALAIDMRAINLSESDVFEDNDQELDIRHSVREPLSTIEKMYNSLENAKTNNILRQAGYNYFSAASGIASSTGKYDSSYKLSIGEKINVLSYGDSVDVISLSGSHLVSPMTTTEVGSNGQIFIPGIGPIKADGRTLGEVEKEANSIAKKKYTNMSIKFQIPSGSGYSVFVYGEVNKPGKVYISNNSTILDVLKAAGGVKKTGTLRNIKYNNKNVDLYSTLFLGNDNNIIVKANDKIFVDTIKKTMSFKNGVTNPGIYEFKTGETIGDMIKYAGDLLVTTQRTDVVLDSFDKNEKQKVARNIDYTTAKNTKLTDGDSVEFQEMYNEVENIVTLQGNIKRPAVFAYKEGMRLSDIIKSQDDLMEETFIYQAVIRRVSGKDNSVETIPVYLKDFFAGKDDPFLQPKDIVTVYKNTNRTFIDVYGCINLPKHIPYTDNMKLSDIMSNIQFMESNIDAESPKTENSTAKENEKSVSDNTIKEEIKSSDNKEDLAENKEQNVKENEKVTMSVSTQISSKLIPAENVAVEITNKDGDKTDIYYLYDIMINGDRISKIVLKPEDKVFFRTLRKNETIKTVKISGFVKRPGVYSFVKGQKLTELIEMAGGLDEEADMRGIVFNRANLKAKQTSMARYNAERDIKLIEGRLAAGYKQAETAQNMKLTLIEQLEKEQLEYGKLYTGRIALNIRSNDLTKISKMDNIEMQDGDDVYIPRESTYIAVLGEVYNEQAFIYTKGTTVKHYIKQVGGYTPNANKFRIYKIGVNGKSEKIHLSTKVQAGDTIVVPRRVSGNDWITPIVSTIQGIAYFAVIALSISRW